MITVLSVLFAVWCFATRGSTLTCPPCDPSVYPCPEFNASQCLYEVVKDACNCCPECAKAPGEQCGGVFQTAGFCTNASRCLLTIEYGLPYSTYIQSKGTCEDISPLPSPTPLPNTTTMPSSTTTTPTNTTTTSLPPSPTPTPRLSTCRTPCSVDFCWDGLNRYCTSNSTVSTPFNIVKERMPCQHTTCKACRLHVSPICPTCPEPVNKRCLRHYFLCLAEHYKRNDIVLELSDPRAMTAFGKVVCNVPLLEEMEIGSGEK